MFIQAHVYKYVLSLTVEMSHMGYCLVEAGRSDSAHKDGVSNEMHRKVEIENRGDVCLLLLWNHWL